MKPKQARKSPQQIILLLLMILALSALACTAAGTASNNTGEESADTTDEDTEPAEEPAEGDEVEEEPPPAEDPAEEPPEDESECPFSGVYVSDVSIPDGTEILPDASFDKTWRIQNDGCQNWTEGTILIFDHGDRMGAADFVSIPNTLTGNTADVTVSLTAPSDPGTYTGYWQCQSPDGVRFCQVYVEIVVPEPPTPTPEPTAEVEPVQEYIPAAPSPRTGNVSTGGCSPGMRVGIAPAGNAIRTGASFDVTAYHGKEITAAILLLDDYTHSGAEFYLLGPLNVELIEFINACDVYDQAGSELLGIVTEEDFLTDPIWVTDAVDAAVNGGSPQDYFQVKLSFAEDDSGASYAAMTEWTTMTLIIEYIP